MSEQEERARLQEAQEQLRVDFEDAVTYVMSGRSTGLVMMTFGEGGKTLLSGDPAQLLLALETARVKLLQFHLARQEQQRAAVQTQTFFSDPTAGSC